MAPSRHMLLFLLSFFNTLLFPSVLSDQSRKHYVVYMGASRGNQPDPESAHLQLLSSVVPREESERVWLVHHYKHALKGFSAMLTQREASSLSGREDVVSVIEDPVYQLHTTRSWEFLDSISGVGFSSPKRQYGRSDVIIGMIDTGIWPESPSFSDEGVPGIPSGWKGVCMEGPDFKTSHCNRKLIGARYYNFSLPAKSSTSSSSLSPRDSVGHGTHTSSIASGALVHGADYFGLAPGTAHGGMPSSRIAVYKACSEDGCAGSTILKAIDDAVHDGVHIISISIGMSSVFQADYLSDPIAIGAFHAEEKGVAVVCSGGNEGPDPFTVVNTAPWIFTVAASSIDRDFESLVVLGNGRSYKGSGISFSNLTRSETYPIVFGKDVAARFVPVSEARSCSPGSLDLKKVPGKIVVCVGKGPNLSRKIQKLVVEDARAKGIVLINEDQKSVPFDSGVFPFSQVSTKAGYKILKYINNLTSEPTATILPTVGVPRYRPAPTVAYFSSRGPSVLSQDILKPDVMAPGVAILGAMIPESEPGSAPNGEKPSRFAIKSGTSMACPHVTGAAASVMSLHPSWTPSMLKSALLTTATAIDNTRTPLKNSSGAASDPHETGSGEISPSRAADPGLVFETTTHDYLLFLCFDGYKDKTLRSITKHARNFTCPGKSSRSLISSINYPSISISSLKRGGSAAAQTIQRTATNVGASPITAYAAQVEAPLGLRVEVSPSKLAFTDKVRKASFRVSFHADENARKGHNYGSIAWSDADHHTVRVVFAVNVE